MTKAKIYLILGVKVKEYMYVLNLNVLDLCV